MSVPKEVQPSMTPYELKLWWERPLAESVTEVILKYPDHPIFVGGKIDEITLLVYSAMADSAAEVVACTKLLGLAPEIVKWLSDEDWLPAMGPGDIT
jgi:hypothetical protein